MQDATKPFDPHAIDAPDPDALLGALEGVAAELEAKPGEEAAFGVVKTWDRLRRDFRTYKSAVDLAFSQDTRPPETAEAHQRAQRLATRVQAYDTRIKRALADLPARDALEQRFGRQPFALWQADSRSFDEEISALLDEEQDIGTEYRKLMGGAEVEFAGKKRPLSSLGPWLLDDDRDVRRDAALTKWAWVEKHGEAFDDIYDRLVKLRHRIAKALGLSDFTELGYLRMHRVDYDRDLVAGFRDAVIEHVVPLCGRIRASRARGLGLEALMPWDEGVSPGGNPVPPTEPDAFLDAARKVFDAVDPEVGRFFGMMRDRKLLDLPAREGKAPGGFCTFLPALGVPFVFANCNGTHDDVRVLTHEIGHAFQMYKSRGLEPIDVVHATYEACEVHSMSMEFLTWPALEEFFGDAAERFRQSHLQDAITFLPYGCLVDHFQHEVYANPDATPAERREIWRTLEARYRPEMDLSDVPHLAAGGRWHMQLHVFQYPFYYIDYVLAQTCALQMHAWARRDRETAVREYIALCERGGSLPFQALCRSASLRSPLEPDCLRDVIEQTKADLTLD